MKISHCVVEINNVLVELEDISFDELQNLTDIMSTKAKSIVLKNTEINDDDNGNNSTVTNNSAVNNEDLKRLKRLRDTSTTKQHEVLNYFMNNPGEVYGDTLKQALPFLDIQGALPGVFSASRRFIKLGGKKEDSPFAQIRYERERGCGVYRGLTNAEIEYLKTV